MNIATILSQETKYSRSKSCV